MPPSLIYLQRPDPDDPFIAETTTWADQRINPHDTAYIRVDHITPILQDCYNLINQTPDADSLYEVNTKLIETLRKIQTIP